MVIAITSAIANLAALRIFFISPIASKAEGAFRKIKAPNEYSYK